MFSQREAKALGKDMVFTQHLLLGLMAEDRASGGFLGSGITVEPAREFVQSFWPEDNGNGGTTGVVLQSETSAMDVPFSTGAKRVFEAAVEYSRDMRLGANVNHLAAVAVSRLQGKLVKKGRETPTSAFKRSYYP